MAAWSVRPTAHVVFLALLGALLYLNVLHAPFVFDDYDSIVKNPLIRDLSNYVWNGRGYSVNPTRVLGYASFAINYQISSLNVVSYRIVNVLVHIFNALLLYSLVHLTVRTPILEKSTAADRASVIAFVAALLFVVHPLNTEAVTYVVQRLTSLATMFYLLALVLYARWRLAAGSRLAKTSLYAGGLAASAAAMVTKEIAFTLPVMMAVYELCFFTGRLRKRLPLLLPFLATSLIIPLSLLSLDQPIGQVLSDVTQVTRVQSTLPRLDYLATQFVVLGKYLGLLLWPSRQNLDHDVSVHRSFTDLPVVGSAVLLLGLVAFLSRAWWLSSARSPARTDRAGWRLVAFGLAWFLVTLSVESTVVPIVDLMFEHRMYLPSVGCFLAAGAGGWMVVQWLGSRARSLGTALFVVVAALLSILTVERNRVWASEVALWTDAAAKSPHKARPHLNLGVALLSENRAEEALAPLATAIRLDPGGLAGYTNLGAVFVRLGRREEAAALLERALRLASLEAGDVETYTNVAAEYAELGDTPRAMELLRRVIDARPDYPDAHYVLGNVYSDSGSLQEAVGEYRETVRWRPEYADAHNNLGIAYARLGNVREAEAEFRTAARLSPDDEEYRSNLSRCATLGKGTWR